MIISCWLEVYVGLREGSKKMCWCVIGVMLVCIGVMLVCNRCDVGV